MLSVTAGNGFNERGPSPHRGLGPPMENPRQAPGALPETPPLPPVVTPPAPHIEIAGGEVVALEGGTFKVAAAAASGCPPIAACASTCRCLRLSSQATCVATPLVPVGAVSLRWGRARGFGAALC